MSKSRSTILDKAKVRARAWECNIHSQAQLEIAYCNHFNKHGEHRPPKCAWNGDRFSTGGAREIADLLRVASYHELEPDKTIAPWAEFLQTCGVNESFSDLIIEDPNTVLKGMLDFNPIIPADDLRIVDANYPFYFQLQGEVNECFMILLSSPTETLQLAPIGIDGFDNVLHDTHMRYPNFSITFDKNKLGWRRFLVIKGRNLPITIKDKGDFLLSANELNTLAFKLQELDIMINSHEFMLIKG